MEDINLKFGDIKDFLPKQIIKEFCDNSFNEVELYPVDYSSLIELLSKKHDINKDNFVLTNGVDEGIELIARLFKGDILFFPPSYFEFKDAPRRNGFKFMEINCFDGKGYVLKYKDIDVKNRSLIYLCNPNNPFGLIKKEEILNLCKKTNGIVAIDETYIDFGGESVIEEIKSVKNLLVLRSFSKSYSVAGLRVGYVIGDKELIDKIKSIKLYCNISSVSFNCAKMLLHHEDYFIKLRKAILERKNDFEVFMKENKFNIIHTETNNILIKFDDVNEANNFFNFLKENKVIVNQGDGMSTCGLDNTFIRFSCGREDQMKKVKQIILNYKK